MARLSIQYTDRIRRAVEQEDALGLGDLKAEAAVVTKLAEIGAATVELQAQQAARVAFYRSLASDPSYEAELMQQIGAAIEDRTF